MRNLFLLAAWVYAACAAIGTARADFTATYTPLQVSPHGVPETWYGGAVTNDGKFIYGLGNSHNSYGNNAVWAYDPATNSHKKLFPDTGDKWVWDKDANGKPVAGTGRWAALSPTDPRYAFFGGPTITAITNRNNHQQFTMRNEWWVLAGTTYYQGGGHFAGRFSLDTNRWVNVSKSLGEFSAGLIANASGWAAANASTAVCKDLDTVVLFGGMQSTAGVKLIEPNPPGPEPYRMVTLARPPIYLPSENARESAVCAGDTVYYLTAQERVPNTTCCRTPNPAPFWKFHVPTRTWTRLPDGPPGGYFPVLTYDSDNGALLSYGGGPASGSNSLWAYNIAATVWQDLTGTTAAPRANMHTGGFIPGFGHVYKGGKINGSPSPTMHRITLTRPVVALPEPEPVLTPTPEGTKFVWRKLPLPGYPLSPQGSMKHQRLVEHPDGRVYILGGDFGGGAENTGRQLVYSFDPREVDGGWKLEAPECGTVAHPVHWHTDEAGVAWDAKRNIFWKLAGAEYGPADACLAAGRSVKAKVIQFDPATRLWTVPPGVDQARFGYVTNGVIDPSKDQMIQIIDKQARHLNLMTGAWTIYSLPGSVKRFNAIVTRLGRGLWWVNRNHVLESYDLDTHALATHGLPPWPPPTDGWAALMVNALGDKVLVVKPTMYISEADHAALYDPATKTWTTLDLGDARGNTALVTRRNELILMGGGISSPPNHNKWVHIGALQ